MRHWVVKTRSEVTRADSEPQPVVRDFEQFYRQNYGAVVGIVFGLSGSRHAAEDIAQEAFLRAHRSWADVRGHPNPEGWVRLVAMNLARSRLRRLGAETRALARFAGMNHTPFPEIEPPNETFWKAVHSLPHRQREVVALHYLEDMAVADIAQVLEIAVSTVKNSLAQARSNLAMTLEVTP